MTEENAEESGSLNDQGGAEPPASLEWAPQVKKKEMSVFSKPLNCCISPILRCKFFSYSNISKIHDTIGQAVATLKSGPRKIFLWGSCLYKQIKINIL